MHSSRVSASNESNEGGSTSFSGVRKPPLVLELCLRFQIQTAQDRAVKSGTAKVNRRKTCQC